MEIVEEPTVNSIKRSKSTVNSRTTVGIQEKVEALLEEANITPEGVAKMLTEMLDDSHSLQYFKLLARENSHAKLLEAAHITKEAALQGKIRVSKPVYFLGILRKWGMRTKFKRNV